MKQRETIFDPLRKKEVALTPEERVRQWCISVLAEQMKVPLHMMMSEVGFGLGAKQLRADVVVFDRKGKPLMVVECKRPDVDLTVEVLDQVMRYNMVLDVKFMLITNATKTYICSKQGEKYEFMDSVPTYEDMLA